MQGYTFKCKDCKFPKQNLPTFADSSDAISKGYDVHKVDFSSNVITGKCKKCKQLDEDRTPSDGRGYTNSKYERKPYKNYDTKYGGYNKISTNIMDKNIKGYSDKALKEAQEIALKEAQEIALKEALEIAVNNKRKIVAVGIPVDDKGNPIVKKKNMKGTLSSKKRKKRRTKRRTKQHSKRQTKRQVKRQIK